MKGDRVAIAMQSTIHPNPWIQPSTSFVWSFRSPTHTTTMSSFSAMIMSTNGSTVKKNSAGSLSRAKV